MGKYFSWTNVLLLWISVILLIPFAQEGNEGSTKKLVLKILLALILSYNFSDIVSRFLSTKRKR